jgi:Sulfotransferase domain
MKRPDFFIVGAPRCGTTALHAYLNAHPEIFMCSPKEPHFFAEDVKGDRRKVRAWQDYLALFEGADGCRRAGDASTTYLRSRSAAGLIKAFNPASKIIVMLRNPLDVIYSLHSLRVYDGSEMVDDLEVALERDHRAELAGNTLPEQPGALPYREVVRFSRQLLRYFAEFGRENLHVIVYDDFQSNTSLVYRQTLEFLGVRPDFECHFARVNQNRRARSKTIQRLLRQPPAAVRRISRAFLPLSARRFVGESIRCLNGATELRPPMKDELRKRLQREFEPEVEELSQLLNRDLTAWCR